MDSGSESDNETLQIKVIILGDGAVGKTSLVHRYCNNDFAQSYKQTIGVDFFHKKVEVPSSSGQMQSVSLQIWDIGGQQIGGKMISKYIYGCDAVFFIYDVTNPNSFKNVADWMVCVQEAIEGGPGAAADSADGGAGTARPFMALVGNKVDLTYGKVTVEQHASFAAEYGMSAYLVSAKSGEYVENIFSDAAKHLLRAHLGEAQPPASSAPTSSSQPSPGGAPTNGGNEVGTVTPSGGPPPQDGDSASAALFATTVESKLSKKGKKGKNGTKEDCKAM